MNKITLPRRDSRNREQSIEGKTVSLKTQPINVSIKFGLFTRTPVLAFYQKCSWRFIFLSLAN